MKGTIIGKYRNSRSSKQNSLFEMSRVYNKFKTEMVKTVKDGSRFPFWNIITLATPFWPPFRIFATVNTLKCPCFKRSCCKQMKFVQKKVVFTKCFLLQWFVSQIRLVGGLRFRCQVVIDRHWSAMTNNLPSSPAEALIRSE